MSRVVIIGVVCDVAKVSCFLWLVGFSEVSERTCYRYIGVLTFRAQTFRDNV